MSETPRDDRGRFDATPSLSARPSVGMAILYTFTQGMNKWEGFIFDNVIESMLIDYSRTIDIGWNDFITQLRLDLEAKILPLVAFKTGRLREAYGETFATIQSIISGNFIGITESDFQRQYNAVIELSRVLQAVDYAQYHIVETSGKLTYEDPTVAGTRPISKSDIDAGVGMLLIDVMMRTFTANGWDASFVGDPSVSLISTVVGPFGNTNIHLGGLS